MYFAKACTFERTMHVLQFPLQMISTAYHLSDCLYINASGGASKRRLSFELFAAYLLNGCCKLQCEGILLQLGGPGKKYLY